VAFNFSEQNSLDFKQSVQDCFRSVLYSSISRNHHSFLLSTSRSDCHFLRGTGRFPSVKNIGSGTMTQNPHGIIDAGWQGSVMPSEGGSGDQFMWWAHEKDKVVEGGKVRTNHGDRIFKFTKVILDE
jgi:hypothetical protein